MTNSKDFILVGADQLDHSQIITSDGKLDLKFSVMMKTMTKNITISIGKRTGTRGLCQNMTGRDREETNSSGGVDHRTKTRVRILSKVPSSNLKNRYSMSLMITLTLKGRQKKQV